MSIRTGRAEIWVITFSDIEGNSIEHKLGQEGGPLIPKLKAIKHAKRHLAENLDYLAKIDSVTPQGE